MENNKNIIVILILLVITSIVSYYIGSIITYNKFEKDLDNHKLNYQSFYATITDIKDTGLEKEPKLLTIKGLDINDINFRGDFEFVITEATELEWRYTKLKIDELEVGDNIAIIFTGNIQEKVPAHIEDVLKIQLLDD